MKSRSLIQIVAVICLLSTTSCVSFLEKVFFRADGSGTYTFSVDLTSMLSMAEMAGEEMDADQLMRDLKMDQGGTIAKLEAINGVNNVRPEFNKETNMLSMIFDFDNVDALNQGISTYLHDSTKTEVVQHEIFTMKGKSIERNNINLIMDTLQKSLEESSADGEVDMSFAKMMFSDMFYAVEIETEKGIKSFSNNEYEEKNNNTISWRTYPFNDLGKKSDISVKVKTK